MKILSSSCLIICFSSIFISSISAFKFLINKNIIASYRVNSIQPLYARIAKAEEESGSLNSKTGVDKDENISVPYRGLVGYEPGSLFNKPVEVFDPLKDTSDLPGEDGSDEKILAIQNRIQERVEALKKAGQWDDQSEEFGKDPLARQSILQTMIMQIKACRPYENVSDLALTYTLVLISTFSIMIYLIFLREVLDNAINWYVNTDFDSDFLSNLLG